LVHRPPLVSGCPKNRSFRVERTKREMRAAVKVLIPFIKN
jgi:hypothetical protein